MKGTFNTLREAAKRLREGGRIIKFSSSVVGLLQPTYGVYAGTKAAVEAMTSILAKELRGRSITVNAVASGPTATDLFLHGKPQEVVDRFAKLAPLERLSQPADIAATVAFLAGPDGDVARQRQNHLIPNTAAPSLPDGRPNQKEIRDEQDHTRHRRVQRLWPSDRRGSRQGGPHRLRLDARDHGLERGRSGEGRRLQSRSYLRTSSSSKLGVVWSSDIDGSWNATFKRTLAEDPIARLESSEKRSRNAHRLPDPSSNHRSIHNNDANSRVSDSVLRLAQNGQKGPAAHEPDSGHCSELSARLRIELAGASSLS